MYPQNARRRATYHGHDPSAFTSSKYGDSHHELNVNDFGDRAVTDGEMVTAAPVSRFHNLRTEPSGSSSPPKNAQRMSSNGPIMKQLKGGFGAASKSFASPNYGGEEQKWPSTEIKRAAV